MSNIFFREIIFAKIFVKLISRFKKIIIKINFKTKNYFRKFYLNVDKLMKLHDAVKFMLSILVHLKKQAIRKLTPEENEDKENTIDTLNTVESKQNKDGTISIANDTLQQDLNDPYV